MRKILLALFAIMILTIGFAGYSEITNKPNVVIEEKDYSTEIRL